MKVTEHPTGAVPIEEVFNGYDWLAILTVSIPTLLIALGAGFTIPFLNLFFMNVHGLNSENFSEFTSLAYVLSSMGLLYMPSLKRNIGYQSSIVIFQGLAIFSLIMMVTTEWYKTLPIALPVAVFFFVIRQPLMNVVSPITSELSMRYVGVGSREMISSINASIWSGSWFISGIVFSILRQYNISYSYIFLLTALLYALGTVWYVILIKRMKKVSAE
jgi:MFS family permease